MASQHRHSDRKRGAPQRQRAPHDASAAEAPPHPLVALGRQVGNATVARMLAQRDSNDEEDELQLSRDPALQRDAEEEDELQLSREGPEVGPEGGPVSDATAGRINSMRGGGSALDAATRAQMEGALGDDFSDVRVHTGGEAARLSRSLGARAFTTGADVFFGEGAGPGDRGLLAHELTHVVQQRGVSGGGPLTVGPADDAYEAEAEATARAVSGGAAPAQRRADDEAP